MNYIEIYKDKDNRIEVEVTFDHDTVWLNQSQISELFHTDRTSIQKHLTKIYKTSELKKNQTCAKIAQVQKEGKKSVTRKILYYNLDAVISVGYRVNSKRGVLFRQWATKKLNEHLIKGFTVNQKKLELQTEKIQELKNTIDIISRIPAERKLHQSEASALIDVIKQYTFALDTLDEYDYKNITLKTSKSRITRRITYDEAMNFVEQLRSKFNGSKYFGIEKDKSFNSSLATIFQTFGKLISNH